MLKGVPFRQAHEVVGKLVALSGKKGVPLDQLTLEDFRGASPVFEADVHALFDVRRSLAARRAPGAPSPGNVADRLGHWAGETAREQ